MMEEETVDQLLFWIKVKGLPKYILKHMRDNSTK